jgi:hypothetical protein
METLETFVGLIAVRGCSKTDLIRALVQKAYDSDVDSADVYRLGRLIFFLRHGVPATRATDADVSLGDALAAKLRESGQWT